MDAAQELEAFKAIRQMAAVLVTSAESYSELIVAVEAGQQNNGDLKARALSIGLLAGQIQISSLEALPALKQSIDAPFHPPLTAVLALGAISSSAILIAASSTTNDLDLLSLDSLQRILASKAVDQWLQICLGSSE